MSDLRMNGGGNSPRGPLRRDRRSKAVAGVCGGLGRHLGVDPVIFRILFVVASFVGGLGLLAYAAAWLFVPQEGADRSEAHRMLTGSSPWLAALMAVGLGLGVIAAVSALSNGLSGMWPMWLIAAAVFGLLVWRGDIKLGRSADAGTSGRPPTWWQQPVGGDAQAREAAEETQVSAFVGTLGESGAEPRDEMPPQYAAQSGTPAAAWGSGAAGEPDPGTPARTRRRGYGGLVLANLLAASGVLGVLNAAGAISLTWLSGGALVLMLLGGGMVIGGLFGKTTGLVPIGLVLAIPLIVLSAIGVPLHGTIGDQNWAPASAALARPTYQVGIGDGSLDLTGAAPGAGRTLKVGAQIGIGDLSVIVPADVEVRVHVHDGIGTVDTPDTGSIPAIPTPPGVPGAAGHRIQVNAGSNSAWDTNEDLVIPAASAHTQGTIVLDLNVGVGDVNLEVEQ
jgi:phage shock protein PspC (stress-responsive transcriptional regulator)